MEQINISKSLARECAEALIDKHNAIPQDMEHDNVILVSFRSLYHSLMELGELSLITAAIRPVNPRKLPLFV